MPNDVKLRQTDHSFQQKLDFSRVAVQASVELAEAPFVTSKFGPYASVLLHILKSEFPAIPVVWIDTGFNSDETHEFVAALAEQLDLKLNKFSPRQIWDAPVPVYGSAEHERFVEHTKLEPFARALRHLNPDVWFSALRREQTQYRGGLHHFHKTKQHVLKVSPLLAWTKDDMETYLHLHNLPLGVEANDPTKPAPHLECGLHARFS